MCTTHEICQAVQTALAGNPDVTDDGELVKIACNAAFGNPDDDAIPRTDLLPVITTHARHVAEQRRRQMVVNGLREVAHAG